MLSGGTGIKRYSNVSNVVFFFELQYINHFGLKLFSARMGGKGEMYLSTPRPTTVAMPLDLHKKCNYKTVLSVLLRIAYSG